MEAAYKAALAKGETGIFEKKPAPLLKDFAERDFKSFVDSRFIDKQKTLEYYKNAIKSLVEFAPLTGLSIDLIPSDKIAAYVRKRRAAGVQVTSIKRQLEVIRRMLKLTQEWGKVDSVRVKVEMLPGERSR